MDKPDHMTWQQWIDALRAIAERFPNDPMAAMRLALAERHATLSQESGQ